MPSPFELSLFLAVSFFCFALVAVVLWRDPTQAPSVKDARRRRQAARNAQA